jgi:microcystin degradation protein MlrC
MKIAIAGFVHETVTFLPEETGLSCFEAAALRGDDLVTTLRGSNTAYGGFIEICEAAEATMIPVVASECPPSGPVSEAAFESFVSELIEGIAAHAETLDGVLLHLHGAMATALQQDPELAIVQQLRTRIGRHVPLAVAMDLHGNLSPEFCTACDIICGFHHSPHTDMAETGRRTARLLVRTIAGEITPTMAMRKPGLVLPSVFTATAVPPLADIYDAAHRMAQDPGILDISVFTGFAYADATCIGASAVAIADGSELLAARAANELSSRLHDQRAALFRREDLLTVTQAVDQARTLVDAGQRPVVVLEHADRGNDSTHVLQELVARGVPRVFVPYLTDPMVARAAANTGIGGRMMATVGGKSSDPAGDPVLLSADIRFTGPVRYIGTGPYRTGEPVDLGLCAVLDTGNATIIVTSTNVVAVDTDPFTQFGLNVNDYDIILLRSKTHFRAVYQDLAAAILIAETPDWGCADLATLPYHNVPPGVFPVTA